MKEYYEPLYASKLDNLDGTGEKSLRETKTAKFQEEIENQKRPITDWKK